MSLENGTLVSLVGKDNATLAFASIKECEIDPVNLDESVPEPSRVQGWWLEVENVTFLRGAAATHFRRDEVFTGLDEDCKPLRSADRTLSDLCSRDSFIIWHAYVTVRTVGGDNKRRKKGKRKK